MLVPGESPTIYDVARIAGVSLTTVSRVLHHHPNIKPQTRERVMEAMRALGYRPNLLASALMTKQTHTIGLLVSDISNPFLAEICRGVADAARRVGFNVVVCNTDERLEIEREHISLLRQKSVDGMIFASAEVGDQNITELQQSRYPIVLLTRGVDGPEVSSVGVDDFRGGYLAAKHLIQLGHRRIYLMAGPMRTKPGLSRKKGFEAALEQAGLAPDPAMVDTGPFTLQSGMAMAERMLAAGGLLPTGIVAGNDLIAIGAIKVLRRAGIRIPEDISIVGYDRTTLAEVFEPELTSVAQPIHELGVQALQLLLEQIENHQVAPREIVLAPKLVVGATTRRYGPVELSTQK